MISRTSSLTNSAWVFIARADMLRRANGGGGDGASRVVRLLLLLKLDLEEGEWVLLFVGVGRTLRGDL